MRGHGPWDHAEKVGFWVLIVIVLLLYIMVGEG